MQDLHVVAVEVHGVGGRGGVVDYYTDGAVGAEVFDVPFGGEGGVAFVGEEDGGVVVVGAEGGAV